MSDQWEFYPCQIGDLMASVRVDVGISETIDTDAPPILVRLWLIYKNTYQNGLPTRDDMQRTEVVEDQARMLAERRGAWFVGTLAFDGRQILFIYDASKEKWGEFAGNLAKTTGYELEVTFDDDPEHSKYWDNLYPDDDGWQIIGDLNTIRTFRENGDDGSEPRQIDHWTYFANAAAAQPFINWAQSDGFTYEPEHSRKTEDGRFCVKLTHHSSLDLVDISNHTIPLNRKASEFGGDYDGWGAMLVGARS